MLDSCSYKDARAFAQDLGTITGFNLIYGKRNAAERAIVAARLHRGDLRLIDPRITQSAALGGVSRSLVHFATAVLESNDPDLLRAVETGRLSLPEAAVMAKHPPKNLVETFIASTAAERLELGRVAGVDLVFDSVIVPLL
jgi:hypothetical protein